MALVMMTREMVDAVDVVDRVDEERWRRGGACPGVHTRCKHKVPPPLHPRWRSIGMTSNYNERVFGRIDRKGRPPRRVDSGRKTLTQKPTKHKAPPLLHQSGGASG